MDLNETNYELGLFLVSPPSHVPKTSYPIQSSSTADTTSKQEVKGARRVRNACLQCRERKIRCSRTYPCKGCISRGDGAACDWQGGFPTGNIPNYQKHVADQRRQFEGLQDRIISAKACLNAAVQRDSKLNLKISQHQTGLSFLPLSLSEQDSLWLSTGSSYKPPDSAASNMTSFSTNTFGSSRYWSNEESTEFSPSSADLNNMASADLNNVDPSKETHPTDLFGMRHEHLRYRPLSLLYEEDNQPFDGSNPYSARSKNVTGSSNFFSQVPTAEKKSVHQNASITRRDCAPGSIGASSWRGHSTHEPTIRLSRRQSQPKAAAGVINLHLSTGTGSSETDWPLSLPKTFDKSPSILKNHPRQRSSPSKLEPRSPVTPNRHNQSFNIPYTSIRANDNAPSNLIGSLCQPYLPQRQYIIGHDIVPIAEPTSLDFRDVSWNASLSQNLDQVVQADVALGLMHGGQYCGYMPSGLSLGPIIDTAPMTMYNPNLAANWDLFSS